MKMKKVWIFLFVAAAFLGQNFSPVCAAVNLENHGDQNWSAPEKNPKTPIMKPNMPTTPRDDDYLPGYRPSDANDAAAQHATGQVVSSIKNSGSIFYGDPIALQPQNNIFSVIKKEKQIFLKNPPKPTD